MRISGHHFLSFRYVFASVALLFRVRIVPQTATVMTAAEIATVGITFPLSREGFSVSGVGVGVGVGAAVAVGVGVTDGVGVGVGVGVGAGVGVGVGVGVGAAVTVDATGYTWTVAVLVRTLP